MFGMGFVCLCVGTSYVLAGGLSVCALVQVMFGMGFVCLCVGTSYVCMGFVCSKHSSLIVFGIFGSPEKDFYS